MILYKNVDFCDLGIILREGILPISLTHNNNWKEGKRIDNSINDVYLFQPLSQINSFPQDYGLALLEVYVDSRIVRQSEIMDTDIHKGVYIEYTTPYIKPEEIINVYIPLVFQKSLYNFASFYNENILAPELISRQKGGNLIYDPNSFYLSYQDRCYESILANRKIKWCGVSADIEQDGWKDDYYTPRFREATTEEFQQFAKTAPIFDSESNEYFLGQDIYAAPLTFVNFNYSM